MNSTNQQPVLRVDICRRVWLGIVALMFVLRGTIFFGPWGNECGLSFAYMLCTWPPIMVLALVNGYRFRYYLEEHHHDKWAELTGANEDGSFSVKSFLAPRWVRSSDPTGDPTLDQMKADGRQFVRFVYTVFFTYPVMFPLLIYSRTILH